MDNTYIAIGPSDTDKDRVTLLDVNRLETVSFFDHHVNRRLSEQTRFLQEQKQNKNKHEKKCQQGLSQMDHKMEGYGWGTDLRMKSDRLSYVSSKDLERFRRVILRQPDDLILERLIFWIEVKVDDMNGGCGNRKHNH
jgi:hypothetical protein